MKRRRFKKIVYEPLPELPTDFMATFDLSRVDSGFTVVDNYLLSNVIKIFTKSEAVRPVMGEIVRNGIRKQKRIRNVYFISEKNVPTLIKKLRAFVTKPIKFLELCESRRLSLPAIRFQLKLLQEYTRRNNGLHLYLFLLNLSTKERLAYHFKFTIMFPSESELQKFSRNYSQVRKEVIRSG